MCKAQRACVPARWSRQDNQTVVWQPRPHHAQRPHGLRARPLQSARRRLRLCLQRHDAARLGQRGRHTCRACRAHSACVQLRCDVCRPCSIRCSALWVIARRACLHPWHGMQLLLVRCSSTPGLHACFGSAARCSRPGCEVDRGCTVLLHAPYAPVHMHDMSNYVSSMPICSAHVGSEDNTFRLWDAQGSCLQSVELSGCVWSVAFTPDGDVVAGCADASAYVFSREASRQADAEAVAAFETTVEERKAMTKDDKSGVLCLRALGGPVRHMRPASSIPVCLPACRLLSPRHMLQGPVHTCTVACLALLLHAPEALPQHACHFDVHHCTGTKPCELDY